MNGKMNMATMKDIAEQVGVSRPAVSAVLNNKNNSRVSPENRRKILEIASKMNFQPNFAARALVRQRTHMIGFICGGINEPFFANLTEMMLTEAEARGYRLMTLLTNWSQEKELERLNLMMDSSIDGIIMFSSSLKSETKEYKRLLEKRFPVVLLNDMTPDFTSLMFDIRQGVNELLELISNGGHRKVAMVHYMNDATIKKKVYMESIRKYDLEYEEYIFHNDIDNISGEWKSISECATRIASDPQRPDVLLMFSDFSAIAMISALTKLGINVPDDISVAGMDGLFLGGMTTPPLTSILKDCAEMSRIAIDELIKQIDHPDTYKPRNLLVPTKLIIRNSISKIQ